MRVDSSQKACPNFHCIQANQRVSTEHHSLFLCSLTVARVNQAGVNWCSSLLKWPKSRTPLNTKCWRGHGPTRTVIHCRWGGQMIQVFWKIVGRFLTKLNKFLPYNPATLFLIIYPKELKVHPHKNRHADVYSHFIIVKNGSSQDVSR